MLLLLFFSWYTALLLVLCVLQQMPCCFPSSPIKRYPFALQGPWLKQREFDHLFICLFSPLRGRILLVENYFGIFLLLLKSVTNICQFFCLCLREKIMHLIVVFFFLAALAALYPPWSLTDSLTDCVEFSFRILTKPYQTYLNYLRDLLSWPTWSTWPPGLVWTYPPTWSTYTSVLPTYLICSPVHITSQIG